MYVGVLSKYVNLASGWRPRLFVLQDGVLRYYKIHGQTKVDVYALLESLRQQGDVIVVGVEAGVLEQEHKLAFGHGDGGHHRQPSGSMNSIVKQHHVSTSTASATTASSTSIPTPHAEIHMQIATIRESKADGTKFYVHTGTSTLSLRSETRDDRWVWIGALSDSKVALEETRPPHTFDMREHSAPEARNFFSRQLVDVEEKLKKMGAGNDVRHYVFTILSDVQAKYHTLADSEFSKRLALLDIVYTLENEKRQLETNAAIEARNSLRKSMSDVSRDSIGMDEEDASVAGREGADESPVHFTPEESSEDEEEYFDCETVITGVFRHRKASSLGELASFDFPSLIDLVDVTDDFKFMEPSEMAVATSDGSYRRLSISKLLPEPEWLKNEGPPPVRRTALPKPAQPEKSVSLWSLIKEMVGKDLTRVCLPVYFNEPLSALQKTAEDLEYSELLDEAYTYPAGSIERLIRVATFAISPYSSTVGRTTKPFNPLLGETYELVHIEKGFRFIAEKVSHHPTIIAAYAEGRGWTFQGDAEVKSKFWGRSIELKPEGVLKLDFNDGDSYSWNKVTTTINNLILGKIYVDHHGIMRIRCHGSNMCARVRFKEAGLLFDKNPRQVEGVIEKDGRKLDSPRLEGHWDKLVAATWADSRREILWQKSKPPEDPTRYNLTRFAIQLNELTPNLEGKIAPTDCRLRPDQSYTEKGMWEEANIEKQRLEHKQRAARKAAEQGVPLKPRWFTIRYENADLSRASATSGKRHISGKDLSFEYNQEYWQERARGEFSGCRDIFGPNVEQT